MHKGVLTGETANGTWSIDLANLTEFFNQMHAHPQTDWDDTCEMLLETLPNAFEQSKNISTNHCSSILKLVLETRMLMLYMHEEEQMQ